MRYSGIQPQYFPRLHYFARILAADVFVIRDEVQFVRKHSYPDGKVDKSYQAHAPIKQPFGRYLLTVPTKHDGFHSIRETQVSDDIDWVNSHLKTLHIVYGKATCFPSIYPEIETVLNIRLKNLAELNIATIIWGITKLIDDKSFKTANLNLDFINKMLAKQKLFHLKKIIKASESKALSGKNNLTANQKIIALCQEMGVTEDYCGGTAIATYMDRDLFKRHGINIVVQDWKCRAYPQLFTKQCGFIPNLSIIDLLMNLPIDLAIKVVKG